MNNPNVLKASWRTFLFFFALVTVILTAGVCRGAQKGARESFQWAGWEIPAEKLTERGALAIEVDEAAESERVKEDGEEKERSALVLRVSRRAIAKSQLRMARSPIVLWKGIVPGLYRVRARIKYVGDECIIGTPISLGVEAVHRETLGQEFYSFDIGRSGEYAEISFLYEVDPTGEKRLQARRTRHPWHYARYLPEEYPEAAKLKRYQPRTKRDCPGLRVVVTLPQTKYSSRTGMPPNSVRSVSLDWVKLERVKELKSLTMRHVRAQKRWLRPGEKTAFDVAVENSSGEARTERLTVALVRGLLERRVLHTEEITLRPGEVKRLEVPWQTKPDTPIWGYEVRAQVGEGENELAVARDYFHVHPRVYDVHIMGTRHRRLDPFREQSRGNNLVEVFAATRGDCAKPYTEHEQFIAGMSTVAYSYRFIRNAIEHNKSLGVATHMYFFAGGTSTPLLDLYVRKPEWFGSRVNATDQIYRAIQSSARKVREHDFRTGPFEMPKTPHVEHHMNHFFPELMDRVTKQAVRFVKRTGYQGVRFDVGIFAPKSLKTVFGQKLDRKASDMMPQAARNFEQFKEALRAVDPNFEFGANMDSWHYLEHVGNRNNPEPPPPESYPEFIAFAKAGGMFMDEGTMSAPIFGHYMNRYQDALWGMCQKRAVARKYGGTYQLFSPHRDGSGHFCHDDVYWAIMIIASGSYYVGNFSAMPYSRDSVGDFITRFAEFFRSKELRPIPGAPDVIYADAPAELWYADAAVYQDVGAKRRYVIPMINPPVAERFRRNKTNLLPPPVEEPFAVEVLMPEGYRKAAAWMLTWEPEIAAVPLKAEVDGNNVIVQFPGIQLFRTLVVEFEK